MEEVIFVLKMYIYVQRVENRDSLPQWGFHRIPPVQSAFTGILRVFQGVQTVFVGLCGLS